MNITIALRLPAKPLWQNRRYHRRRVAAATSRMRDEAYVLARMRVNELPAAERERLPMTRARAKLVFFWPDRRVRDTRNAEAAMKAAYDGLVDAGVLADDQAGMLSHEPTQMLVDPESPQVLLTITECSA